MAGGHKNDRLLPAVYDILKEMEQQGKPVFWIAFEES